MLNSPELTHEQKIANFVKDMSQDFKLPSLPAEKGVWQKDYVQAGTWKNEVSLIGTLNALRIYVKGLAKEYSYLNINHFKDISGEIKVVYGELQRILKTTTPILIPNDVDWQLKRRRFLSPEKKVELTANISPHISIRNEEGLFRLTDNVVTKDSKLLREKIERVIVEKRLIHNAILSIEQTRADILKEKRLDPAQKEGFVQTVNNILSILTKLQVCFYRYTQGSNLEIHELKQLDHPVFSKLIYEFNHPPTGFHNYGRTGKVAALRIVSEIKSTGLSLDKFRISAAGLRFDTGEYWSFALMYYDRAVKTVIARSSRYEANSTEYEFYVQLGYTLMTNGVKKIDSFWKAMKHSQQHLPDIET